MVRYITYKGKKYPVRLSYKVFKGMKKDLGEVSLEKLGSLDPEVMETMIWYGLISGHQFDDMPFEMKREQMEDVLDECMVEFLQMIPTFFPNAKLGNALPNLESLPDQEEQQQPSLSMKDKT